MAHFLEVMMSPPFKFILGPEKTSMTIPSAIANRVSEPLHAMINNGKFSESIVGQVSLENVQPTVFAAFIQFALTNDYEVHEKGSPKPKPKDKAIEYDLANPRWPKIGEKPIQEESELSESSSSEDDEELNDSDRPLGDEMKYKTYNFATKKRKMVIQPLPFMPGQHDLSRSENLFRQFRKLPQARPRKGKKKECHKVNTDNAILLHASVYNFAELYLVKRLNDISLKKLHAALKELDLGDPKPCGQIMDLLQCMYGDANIEWARDSELRSLVITYCASKVLFLGQYQRFKELLEANGELGADLLYRKAIAPEGGKLWLKV